MTVRERGTELLAETYHQILAEGTLETALDRIADTVSTLIAIDGVSIVGFDDAAEDARPLLERGTRTDGGVTEVEIPMISRGFRKGILSVWRSTDAAPFDVDEVQLVQ